MTDRPMIVRPVAQKDKDSLYALLCTAYKENAPYRLSEKKLHNMIDYACDDREVVVGVIDGDDGQLAGSIGGFFAQWWYTDDWHIEECWNYVHPNYRSLPLNKLRENGEMERVSYAGALIDYMKWVSEHMHMPLHIGILTAERLEAKERLYRRSLERVGSSFVHNIQAAQGPIATELCHG